MAKADTAKPLTKTEIIANIVTATDLPKKDVVAVFDALGEEIKKSFGNLGIRLSPVFFMLTALALKRFPHSDSFA